MLPNSIPYPYFAAREMYMTPGADLWDKGLGAFLSLDPARSFAVHNGYWACQTQMPSLVKSVY